MTSWCRLSRARKFEPQSSRTTWKFIQFTCSLGVVCHEYQKINCFIYPERLQHSFQTKLRRSQILTESEWRDGEKENGDVDLERFLDTTNRANKHSTGKDKERLWSEGTTIHKRGLSAVKGINILSWILRKSKLSFQIFVSQQLPPRSISSKYSFVENHLIFDYVSDDDWRLWMKAFQRFLLGNGINCTIKSQLRYRMIYRQLM